jgi:hypothetical protein
MTLASRLEEVNAMALAGDLPDVDISDKGVKITPLDNSVPSAASPFGDLVYGMLPHPKITEMLDEVDGWTGFTRHFTHLKNNHVRPKDRKLLLTTILADGINLGLTKMAESCPGTTNRHSRAFRPGTSGMKPIQLRWPSWSMPRKKPSGGILGRWNNVIV